MGPRVSSGRAGLGTGDRHFGTSQGATPLPSFLLIWPLEILPLGQQANNLRIRHVLRVRRTFDRPSGHPACPPVQIGIGSKDRLDRLVRSC